MTGEELDMLLAVTAKRFTARDRSPDAGDVLRSLAQDLAGFRSGSYQPAPWWDAVSKAPVKLDSLSQWVLHQPGAADAVRRWAETAPTAEFADTEQLGLDKLAQIEVSLAPTSTAPYGGPHDAEAEYAPVVVVGARVFACLLHQAGHPVSAAFWWKFAAGAQDRTSAYCLYLLHLGSRDLHQAQIWYEQALPRLDTTEQSPAHLENFPQLLDSCAGSRGLLTTRTRRPGPDLRASLQRLIDASEREGCDEGIAAPPDRELAQTLAEFAGNRNP
ncbi:hypothetical protein [Streptacidiphilus melanogenes]|uniref:hypothetical protein n=1 Tax=Streptacidiphilus melanogenes TaxID=411235 RepID=UPI000694A367|nr:hypothetical protein [Streptacidiphilus melanogenes]